MLQNITFYNNSLLYKNYKKGRKYNMRTGILNKFNRKKTLWISKKHPLFWENIGFKTLYASALLMHTRLNDNTNPLSNLELERFILKGFQLTSKEMITMMSLSQEVEILVDEIIEALDTKRKRFLFFLDLNNLSNATARISEEEQKSLDLFADLLNIDSTEKNLMHQFVSFCSSKQYTDCIQLFNQMEFHSFPLTLSDLSYYMVEYHYQNQILPSHIQLGTINYFSGDCVFEGNFTIPSNTTIYISNALVKMNGSFLVDSGTLRIENSEIECYHSSVLKPPYNAFITTENEASLLLKNTTISCSNQLGFLHHKNSHATIEYSTIKNTSIEPAITSNGHTLSIQHCIFSCCYTKQNGGAICIKKGSSQIQGCTFSNCTADYGGAIYANNHTMILGSTFEQCYAAEFGSAIFYQGEIRSNVEKCDYSHCYPKESAIVQFINPENNVYHVSKETCFSYSTIFHCPVIIDEFGIFSMEHATLYLHHHVVCHGIMQLKRVKVRGYEMEERDFFRLETPKTSHFHNCEFDGNDKYGIFYAVRARLRISGSIFKNTAGGRAIYDAFMPVIDNCVFSYCNEGALYCNSGKITNSVFINCRGRSGAGIIMYGQRGQIEHCDFKRCITEYSGGAIDMSGSRHIVGCNFDECRPNNIS